MYPGTISISVATRNAYIDGLYQHARAERNVEVGIFHVNTSGTIPFALVLPDLPDPGKLQHHLVGRTPSPLFVESKSFFLSRCDFSGSIMHATDTPFEVYHELEQPHNRAICSSRIDTRLFASLLIHGVRTILPSSIELVPLT
jgi:hypothetical protein